MYIEKVGEHILLTDLFRLVPNNSFVTDRP